MTISSPQARSFLAAVRADGALRALALAGDDALYWAALKRHGAMLAGIPDAERRALRAALAAAWEDGPR